MKYYLVYLLDYKNGDSIDIKDSYRTKEDAVNSLEKIAIEYVKELQGKQQVNHQFYLSRLFEVSFQELLI